MFVERLTLGLAATNAWIVALEPTRATHPFLAELVRHG